MSQNIYTLDVECHNCGHEQTLAIQKGSRFSHISFKGMGIVKDGDYTGQQVFCDNCGCNTLLRKAKNKTKKLFPILTGCLSCGGTMFCTCQKGEK